MLESLLWRLVGGCWLGAAAIWALQTWQWLKTAQWPAVTIAPVFRIENVGLDWPDARGLAILVEHALSWVVYTEFAEVLFFIGGAAIAISYVTDKFRPR